MLLLDIYVHHTWITKQNPEKTALIEPMYLESAFDYASNQTNMMGRCSKKLLWNWPKLDIFLFWLVFGWIWSEMVKTWTIDGFQQPLISWAFDGVQNDRKWMASTRKNWKLTWIGIDKRWFVEQNFAENLSKKKSKYRWNSPCEKNTSCNCLSIRAELIANTCIFLYSKKKITLQTPISTVFNFEEIFVSLLI